MKVKAVSPDNQGNISKLIEVFKSNYDQNFYLQEVYDSNFWKRSIGKKFTSLVLEDKGEIVGHLGLKKDQHNKNYTELVLPAFKKNNLELVTDYLIDYTIRVSKQQGKALIYCHFPSHVHPKILSLLSLKYKFKSYCLTPSSSGNFLITLMLRLNEDIQGQNIPLFIPNKHSLLIEKLIINELNSINPNYSKKSINFSSCSGNDERAIEFFKPANMRQTKIFINGALLEENSERIQLPTEKFDNPCFYVSLRDKKGLEICKELESYGFRFAGIQPYLRNNHYAVYANFENYPHISLPVSNDLSYLLKYISSEKESLSDSSRSQEELGVELESDFV